MLVWSYATDNYVYMYWTWNWYGTNSRYEIFWNKKLAVWTSGGSYIFFMEKTWTQYRVGINNTDPKVTFDVKGWIKIWNNCEQSRCTDDIAGTIIYNQNNFLWCKKVGNNYKRVSLDGWTISQEYLDGNTNCTINSYHWTQIISVSSPNQY